jgi:nucleoporin POM34
MSGTLSTTVVQPLAQAKSRTVNAISKATSSTLGSTKKGTASPTVQQTPSPGTWQHPKLREITRRQAAARFSGHDAKITGANTALLFVSIYFGSALHSLLSYAASPLNDIYPSTTIATYTLTIFRLYILINIALTLRPLSPYLAKHDTISDIPLTPSQRSLLGLPPSPSPASSGFITPPRYRRSSSSFTSLSSTTSNPNTNNSPRSISANYASSPLSTSRYTLGFSPGSQSQTPFSRTTQRTASGSPFSYSPSASPLLHKAVGRGLEPDFNTTFNGSTSTSGFSPGLSRSQSVKERSRTSGKDDLDIGGSPSPKGFGGIKTDPKLNYKWLYQTGRGVGGRSLPKSESMGF